MPWRFKVLFYLSLGFSLCEFIFPTHVSQAIGFDVGDMVHWIYGFYILIPRNPTEEITLYFYINFQGYFLIVWAIILLVVFFGELRNAKLGNPYDKNLIYAIAIIQLMASLFRQTYDTSGITVMQLSSWGFIFSAIFALIGNKELNLFYIDKGIVNVKKERKVGIVLITISLISIVYCISIFLCWVAPYGTDAFSSLFVIDMFPSLILLLLMLIYGIYSLIRAKRMKKSKLQ